MATERAERGNGIRARVPLSGYHLFVFERYREAYGKTEGKALALIVERWLAVEQPTELAKIKATLEDYDRFRGDNVIPHRRLTEEGPR